MREHLGRFAEILFGEGGVTGADPEDLFEITTAWITLGSHGYESVDRGGLCFSSVESVDFDAVVDDVEDMLSVSAAETPVEYSVVDDDFGYKWVLLSDAMFEDVVTDVHMASDTLITEGYENYLLCAVFAFEDDREVYLVYNFKRGTWYPFVPTQTGQRDTALEDELRDLVGSELDFELDPNRQYPLWGIPF